ncbi:uncharacterized protein LOC110748391, partial [Prunus avium]|uniref:Uncharacterized protein LOC110748391 n=1 Tax=Prunus avium TaxID=42229 RepID=A0A6P5RGT6_PRUAV
MTKPHIELMRRAPFWGLFICYLDGFIIEDACKKSNNDIVSILKCFDKGKKAFVFGERIERITGNDMSLLFGLPYVGEEINFQHYKRIVGSGFMERQLADYKDLSKRVLEEQLLRVVKLHGSVEESDFVRFVCLYFCMTLFFCNSGNNLMKKMIAYVNNLEMMHIYAWATAATQNLENSRLNMNSVESVCGCLVGLLFWVCERTKLIQPTKEREHISSKFVKWNLLELYAKMKCVPIHTLQEIKPKYETSPTIKGTQIMEIISNSDGKISKTHINSIDDFDPIKAFQLLPTQLMECNQEGPSNSEMDIYDMQRKLQEVTTMLDVECLKNKDLFTENERLKKEIVKLQKGKGKDESPEQCNMI